MDEILHLINEMSPYLLLGFLLAGLMHAYIPKRLYGKYLSAPTFRSVFNATLLGIPLPLCSCGVIPTAMSLRREGASKVSVVAFLIATPQTGVDSITATYGLMGLPFAIIRPVAALVTALFGGALACHQKDTVEVVAEVSAEEEIKGNKLWEALKYGYYTMMQDIGKWLVLGLVVAALITVFIPTEWFAVFQANSFASMLLVLCIAIPMYVCATGSIPIAIALMMKGLTPGAALVLLMAGPACNLASMLVVRKVLGNKTLALYLLSIVVGAIAFGCIIDYLQFHNLVNFTDQLTESKACCHMGSSWFSWLCTGFLILLLINALIIARFRHEKGDCCACENSIQTTNMKTYIVEGMNCNHCRMSAEKAIQSVPGVTNASVNLQSKEAQVEGTASDEEICKAVESVGFSCKLKD